MLDWLKDLLQTAFRLVPWPTEPGLRVAGQPNAKSPVLVTGNYDLTVRRLMRALRGSDAWVVVAPSKGINVWCAAAGGHLSTHQVVSALKTSGVAERVEHRDVILPQLAATGVEGLAVFRRAGWRVRFGPVSADHLSDYLASGGEKTDAMRRVDFGLWERLEMAAMWGAPTALVLGGVTAAIHPVWALPLMALVAPLAFAVFLFYDRVPGPRRTVLAGVGALLAVPATLLAGGGDAALAAAIVAPIALTALLTFDYAGSTPHEGGSHFEGQEWNIRLDPDRCAGIYRCWEVCPEACFEKVAEGRLVELAHDDRCVRCGACIVQCPKDALFFEDKDGRRIEPATIRRFKLNLMGKRTVGVPPPRD